VTAEVSLARRLVRRLSVLFAGGISVYALTLMAIAWFSGQVEIETRLDFVARETAAAIIRDRPDAAARFVDVPALLRRLDETGDVRLAALDAEDGRWVEGGADDLGIALRAFAASRAEEASLTTGEAEIFLRRLPSAVGPMLIAVAHGPPGIDDRMRWVARELSTEILPTLLPLVLATLGLTAITVRRTLAPVERLSAAARAIHPGDDATLDGRDAPREVAGLVEAVNEALARLAAALAAQRRFNANAAHELRTPLSVLRARIDALPQSAERDGLVSGTERMARLVDQLLAMGRLEATAPEAPERIELGALARDVLAEIAPLAHRDGKDVALEAPARAEVLGERPTLEAALRNLVENALGHSPPGGLVEVKVQAGPDARIAVADHGPGLPPGDPARMTEPFWRAPDQRRAGTGLGLAIVAEVARRHGGRLVAENRPGGGAVFTLVLPATT
jgi:signal transduction histidine kinase